MREDLNAIINKTISAACQIQYLRAQLHPSQSPRQCSSLKTCHADENIDFTLLSNRERGESIRKPKD